MSNQYYSTDKGKKKYYSYCTVCNVRLHTPRDITEHYGGQLHAAMMAVVRTQLSYTEHFKTLDEKIKAVARKESVIGLEYIFEYAPDSHGVRTYECTLCQRALKDDSIFCHVSGIRHRVLYLSKHHPIMGIDRHFQVKFPVDHRKLQNNAFAIEQTHKRKEIQVVNKVYNPKESKSEFESYTEDVSPPEEELESMASMYEDKNAARRRVAGPPASSEGGGRPNFQQDGRPDGGGARFQYGHEGGPPYPYGSERDTAYPLPHLYDAPYQYDNSRPYPQDNMGDPAFQRDHHRGGGPPQPMGYGGYPQYPPGDPRNRQDDPSFYPGRGSFQEDLCDIDVRSMARGPPFPRDCRDPFQGDYDDIDVRAMSGKGGPGFQGDFDLRSKGRMMGSAVREDTGDLDVRSMIREGGTSFRELRAAHEANLRKERYSLYFPEHNVEPEKDCDSDMEVRSMEFSDCDPEDFWCNEELFDFLRNYMIADDLDVRFAMRVIELFWNGLSRHKERTENLKRRILEEKLRLEEEKKAFLELKSKKESKSPPPSKKQQAAAAAKAGPPPVPPVAPKAPMAVSKPLVLPTVKTTKDSSGPFQRFPSPHGDPRIPELIRRNQPLLLGGSPAGDSPGLFNQFVQFSGPQMNPRGPLIRLNQPMVPGGNLFGERNPRFPGNIRMQLGQWRGQVLP